MPVQQECVTVKKLLFLVTALGFAFATPATAANTDRVVFGQEDCKEGEKWNEETQKCEKGE